MSTRIQDFLRSYCTGSDDHDPPPCPKCADYEAFILAMMKAERRRLIALAREYGTESTSALADQVEQEENT